MGLHRSGHDVVLIARGAHLEAIERSGLTLVDPSGTSTAAIPVVAHPDDLDIAEGDVVMLAMKSQDTLEALRELSRTAPVSTPIACVQNGVENERVALRLFENVYGVCVVGGSAYLEPGVVMAESGPVFGSLDIGRYPTGRDRLVDLFVDHLSPDWVVFARDRVMDWKYTKLLRNLVLAVQALCGANVRQGAFFKLVREEGEACLRAASIAFIDDAAWNEARALGPEVPLAPTGRVIGGSSWQSLARATGSIETAFLNGEILMLSRILGIDAPANELLYDLTLEASRTRQPPGQMTEDDLFALLAKRTLASNQPGQNQVAPSSSP